VRTSSQETGRIILRTAFRMHRMLLRSHDDFTLALIYVFVGDRDDITSTGTIANHDAYNRFDLAFTYSPGLRWHELHDLAVVAKIQNALVRH
jgi:hypothetical protein